MTNAAAIGYMIMAAKRYGMRKKDIEQLEAIMRAMMDEHTEGEAEQEYYL